MKSARRRGGARRSRARRRRYERGHADADEHVRRSHRSHRNRRRHTSAAERRRSPDPDAAQDAASEANLESNAPRARHDVLGRASAAGITMGDGVGRGPVGCRSASATSRRRSTVLTFELTGGSLLHADDGQLDDASHNDDFSLMAGALHYVDRLAVDPRRRRPHRLHDRQLRRPSLSPPTPASAGSSASASTSCAGTTSCSALESFGQLSVVSTKGLVFNSGFCLGLTYY